VAFTPAEKSEVSSCSNPNMNSSVFGDFALPMRIGEMSAWGCDGSK